MLSFREVIALVCFSQTLAYQNVFTSNSVTLEKEFKEIKNMTNVVHDTICANFCVEENHKVGGFCNAYSWNEDSKTCKIGLRCNDCKTDSNAGSELSDVVYSTGSGLDLGIRSGGTTYNSSVYGLEVELINYQGEFCEGHGIPDLPYPNMRHHGIVTFEGKRIYICWRRRCLSKAV